MRKKHILLALAIGIALTLGSVLINRKTAFPHCAPKQLTEVKKGFPLPYAHLKPSESNCWSVEPVSIFWRGGAFHETYPLNFAADLIFWTGFSALLIGSTRYIKQEERMYK
jgi:hypothetical protein